MVMTTKDFVQTLLKTWGSRFLSKHFIPTLLLNLYCVFSPNFPIFCHSAPILDNSRTCRQLPENPWSFPIFSTDRHLVCSRKGWRSCEDARRLDAVLLLPSCGLERRKRRFLRRFACDCYGRSDGLGGGWERTLWRKLYESELIVFKLT